MIDQESNNMILDEYKGLLYIIPEWTGLEELL